MLVNELMDNSPIQVDVSAALSDAIPLMSQQHRSCLVVVEDSKPVGIITERDVTQLFARAMNDASLARQTVSKVMTEEPLCILDDSSLKDALVLSRSRKLRHLPVVNEQGQLVGMVHQTLMVDAYINLIERNSELESYIEELKLLSLEDPLMGIGNRRAMEVELSHTEVMSKRNDTPYSVALLDIDHFKAFNDHYGHQKGDETLVKVAKALQSSLRGSDRIFRYGGEELLVILKEADEASAKLCGERLRQSVEALNIYHCKTDIGVVTASIGLATSSEHAWRGIVERADQALYIAKETGRNKVCSG